MKKIFKKKESNKQNLGGIIKMSAEDLLKDLSKSLKVEIELLKAFLKVESSGKHFNDMGRVTIRFEKHIFKKYSKKYKESDWQEVQHRNQRDEYDSFIKATKIDRDAAFKSISMGSAQIMGFNCKKVGYETAVKMYNNFRTSANYGILAFGEFIRSNSKLLKACQKKDYHTIASQYNGRSYKKFRDSAGRTYADKIEIFYQKFKSEK